MKTVLDGCGRDRRGFTLIELPFDGLRVVRQGARGAFTLIELLVVVAIIAMLISILMPSLQRAREQSKRAVCASNHKNMGLATQLYTEDHNGWVTDWRYFLWDRNPPQPHSESNRKKWFKHAAGMPIRYIGNDEVKRCPAAKQWPSYASSENWFWSSRYGYGETRPSSNRQPGIDYNQPAPSGGSGYITSAHDGGVWMTAHRPAITPGRPHCIQYLDWGRGWTTEDGMSYAYPGEGEWAGWQAAQQIHFGTAVYGFTDGHAEAITAGEPVYQAWIDGLFNDYPTPDPSRFPWFEP